VDIPEYVSDANRLRRLADWYDYLIASESGTVGTIAELPWFDPYPMVPVAPDLRRIADDIEEHRASFDLRWKADMRAIKRWQNAHPGKQLVWPDHADLVVWLLEQLEPHA
jgi:hypothetical protein